VTRAALLAGAAGACAVLGGWEALVVLERAKVAAAVARVLAPLRRARKEGREPTAPERRRLALLAAGTLLAGGWILFGPLGGVLLAAAGPPVLLGAARARRRRYLAELARGAPLAARALSDALAGGHAIRGAIGQAARGLPGAAGSGSTARGACARAARRPRAWSHGASSASTVSSSTVDAAEARPMLARPNRLSMMNLAGTSLARPGPPCVIATTTSNTLTTPTASSTKAVPKDGPSMGSTMLR